jgi:hypothetical protein
MKVIVGGTVLWRQKNCSAITFLNSNLNWLELSHPVLGLDGSLELVGSGPAARSKVPIRLQVQGFHFSFFFNQTSIGACSINQASHTAT